jgi:hypothetical protein
MLHFLCEKRIFVDSCFLTTLTDAEYHVTSNEFTRGTEGRNIVSVVQHLISTVNKSFPQFSFNRTGKDRKSQQEQSTSLCC